MDAVYSITGNRICMDHIDMNPTVNCQRIACCFRNFQLLFILLLTVGGRSFALVTFTMLLTSALLEESNCHADMAHVVALSGYASLISLF